jgi:ABC-type transporter Mla subunit MlaD
MDLSLLGPLTVPPKLLLRALDDLHTLATSSQKLADAVGELPKIERRVRERIDALDQSLSSMTELSLDMRRTVDQMRALQEAVLNLIRSTDTLTLAIQPLEAFGRRMGRFADRLPGRGGGRGAAAEG